jgi:hypothetical protein
MPKFTLAHMILVTLWNLYHSPNQSVQSLEPKTGASIRIRAGKTVRFKASPILKRAV